MSIGKDMEQKLESALAAAMERFDSDDLHEIIHEGAEQFGMQLDPDSAWNRIGSIAEALESLGLLGEQLQDSPHRIEIPGCWPKDPARRPCEGWAETHASDLKSWHEESQLDDWILGLMHESIAHPLHDAIGSKLDELYGAWLGEDDPIWRLRCECQFRYMLAAFSGLTDRLRDLGWL